MATITAPLAALTTIFTPPCPITWLLTSTKVPSAYPSFATTAPASCDPPSWGEYIAERGFEYYSPAICPSGFSIGPSCIITNPRTAQGFQAIQSGETAAYCVPSGHTCTSDTSDFRGGVWGASRTASVPGARVTVGPAIQIRWRSQDLSELATDPLTPGPRTTLTQVAVPQLPDINTRTATFVTSSPSPTSAFTTSLATSITTSTSTSAFTSASTSISTSISTSSGTPMPQSESNTTPSVLAGTSQSSPQSSPTINGAATSPQDKNSRGDTTSKFTVAATVLTITLISIIVAYSTYSILQRYRRYRAGETPTFFAFEIGAWAQQFLENLTRQRRDDVPVEVGEKARSQFSADAELGTEGPLTELGATQPFGTNENPAELPTERWSWRSRVSRIFTVRPRHGSSPTSGS